MNAPSFRRQFYSVTTPENTPVGITLLKVTATDKDYVSSFAYNLVFNKKQITLNELSSFAYNLVINKKQITLNELSSFAYNLVINKKQITLNEL